MDKLVSVIIPIYKVEEYLRECVENIMNQTYKNLEIILVDDESPDKCGEICEEYKEKDDRIVVIHKENGGLSDARNAGMKIMKGEYIVFVDSDDYMAPDGIEYLVKLLEERDADMVIGGERSVLDTREVTFTTMPDGKEIIEEMDVEEALVELFVNGCSSWGRVYRRAVHEGIEFPKGEINEDEAIMVKLIENCKKIVKTNRPVYDHRVRAESITTVDFSRKRLIWVEHCKNNYEYVKGKYPDGEKAARRRYGDSLVWALDEMMKSSDEKENFKKDIEDCRKRLKEHLSFYLFGKGTSLKYKIRAWVIYKSENTFRRTKEFFNWIRKEYTLAKPDREEWIMAIRKRGDNLLFEENGTKEEFGIIPNSIRYWCADPFLINKDGREYVFFEMYDRWKEKGLVGYREILDTGKFSKMKVVLECPYHLSYPNIFEKDGEVYFIPESFENKEIAIYKATSFPDVWTKSGVLLDDVEAVDTTFINEEFALTRTGKEGSVEKGATLLRMENGKFVEIGNNPVETDSSYARCGGKIFDLNGEKIRVAQDCVGGYGMGLYFRRIKNFGDTAYEEETIRKIEITDVKYNSRKKYDGIHTYNFDEKYEIVDLKIAKAYHFINVVSRYKNRGMRLLKKILRRR